MAAPTKPKVFKPKTNTTHRVFDARASWALLYDKDWQTYRAKFLRANFACYVCGKRASVVDHVVPAQGNRELFEKLDNHAPLCSVHHNTITAKFDRFHMPGKSIEKKLQWIADERARRGIVSRVKVLPSYR